MPDPYGRAFSSGSKGLSHTNSSAVSNPYVTVAGAEHPGRSHSRGTPPKLVGHAHTTGDPALVGDTGLEPMTSTV